MSQRRGNSDQPVVVGLGEALFDHFADDSYVLGGAPLNLAVHSHQLFGGRGIGAVASKVGDDDLGQRVRDELARWNISTEFVAVSSEYPTGTVEVEVDDAGQASYLIRENVAWDHLEFTNAWGELTSVCSAVCFGTLAQRSPESRAAIQQFLINAPQALKVCDLNLRQYYYTAEIIHESLVAADVLKLNESELASVSKALAIGNPVGEALQSNQQEISKTIDVLLKRYNLKLLALTRAELGTKLFSPDERVEGSVPVIPRRPNADSVGAGDACCAGIVVGWLLGKSLQEIVNLANLTGAFVASQPGATPAFPREILESV